LIIIVVGDEIFYGVVGEELFELTIKLGREGLVVTEHQGRPSGLRDDIGNGKRLAASGYTEKGLMSFTFI
jgi:hypothetical protein